MISTAIIQFALIVIAEAFWISSSGAQLSHVIKKQDTKGLSAVTVTLYAAGNVAWMTYFVSRHLWLAFAGDFILFALTVALLGYMLTNRKLFYKGIGSIATIGPLAGAALIAFPGSSGWIGVGLNVIAELPQLYRIIRYKKVSGISLHSQIYALGAVITTLIYGILVDAAALVVGCLQGIFFISITLFYRHMYRSKQKAK